MAESGRWVFQENASRWATLVDGASAFLKFSSMDSQTGRPYNPRTALWGK